MIQHLSSEHSVVVASLARNAEECEQGEDLREHCEDVIVEVVPDRIRWAQAAGRLPTPNASSLAYFWSPRLHRRIWRRLRSEGFDLIFVHCAFVAQYVADWKKCVRVLDFGDLDSAKWMAFSKSRAFPLSVGYAIEAMKLRRYEASVAGEFDRCSVTTQGEMDDYERLGVSTPCTLVPNGVDMDYFSPRKRTDSTPLVVFLGRMDYYPNIDAVNYFVDAIWPIVRRKVPNAEFRVVGSNPGRRVQALSRTPGITVTGHVPDVRHYVQDAFVSVVPLRIARGTQNKILESMAMGIPVVATPMAARGVRAVAGQHLLVSDEPMRFANHVVTMLENEELGLQISGQARTQIANTHSWTTSMRLLDEMLMKSLAGGRRGGPVVQKAYVV